MDDSQLIDHVKGLLKREAALDLEMIESLREIHRRKLYMSYGTNSFHDFCTKVLGMASDSAWRRMHAASLVDRFPDVVKPLIAEGKVHLTGLALLDKVITPENGERLLNEAAGKSKTQIKAIIAREDPKPDCNAGVRKLPARTKQPEQLSEKSWKFQANLDVEGHALFAEVADLLGSDDCNAMLKRALRALRDELYVSKRKTLKRTAREGNASASGDANANASVNANADVNANASPTAPGHVTASAAGRRAQAADAGSKDDVSAKADAAPVRQVAGAADSARPAPPSRYVPRWMEREVRARDGHRCTFFGSGGRCSARRHLQVHHIIPLAQGGPTELGNLTLHCAVHNRYQAELDFGHAVANAWRARGG